MQLNETRLVARAFGLVLGVAGNTFGGPARYDIFDDLSGLAERLSSGFYRSPIVYGVAGGDSIHVYCERSEYFVEVLREDEDSGECEVVWTSPPCVDWVRLGAQILAGIVVADRFEQTEIEQSDCA